MDALVGTQWIELDGHSLRIEELMKIGRGEYRVKVGCIGVSTLR